MCVHYAMFHIIAAAYIAGTEYTKTLHPPGLLSHDLVTKNEQFENLHSYQSICGTSQRFFKGKCQGEANRDFLKFKGGKCCMLALLAFICHCAGLTSLYTVLFQVNSSAKLVCLQKQNYTHIRLGNISVMELEHLL